MDRGTRLPVRWSGKCPLISACSNSSLSSHGSFCIRFRMGPLQKELQKELLRVARATTVIVSVVLIH